MARPVVDYEVVRSDRGPLDSCFGALVGRLHERQLGNLDRFAIASPRWVWVVEPPSLEARGFQGCCVLKVGTGGRPFRVGH